MNIEQKFSVDVQGQNIILTQKVVKTMSVAESIEELNKLRQEHLGVKDNIKKLNKYIDDEEPMKQLVTFEKDNMTLDSLTKEWESKTNPLMDDIKKKIKKAIQTEKVDRGYMRIKDKNEKIVIRANILGKISNEFNLDVSHPIIKEMRANFDA